jgi:hypothetical protein
LVGVVEMAGEGSAEGFVAAQAAEAGGCGDAVAIEYAESRENERARTDRSHPLSPIRKTTDTPDEVVTSPPRGDTTTAS